MVRPLHESLERYQAMQREEEKQRKVGVLLVSRRYLSLKPG